LTSFPRKRESIFIVRVVNQEQKHFRGCGKRREPFLVGARAKHATFTESSMPRTVYCEKLKVEAEGLNFAPYPGELGKRIYEHISKQAWAQWLAHQTMLINENRLSPLDPKARKYLEGEMEKFLFGDGSAAPAGYVPPAA
jgi:Fe-S cluster biosynthesis and repair protein YggX